MSRSFKFFLILFLVSSPVWLFFLNIVKENLEEFLFWQEMASNPKVLASFANQESLERKLRDARPIRNRPSEDLEIKAKSAISVLSKSDEIDKILYEKESEKILPIASLTKLMTAFVTFKNYKLDQLVEIKKEAIQEEEEFGNLRPGDILKVKDLLYTLLIESSNDAAQALAEVIGEKVFVELMNLEAENMGLKNTFFVNPTGLDPDSPSDQINKSNTKDLVKFIKHLLDQPFIWEILSTFEFDLYSPDGNFHHRLKNTNELLQEDLGLRIIGGKTGWTPESGECFLLVLEAPKNKGYLVNIILGAENRFEEMRKLVNWLREAYKW